MAGLKIECFEIRMSVVAHRGSDSVQRDGQSTRTARGRLAREDCLNRRGQTCRAGSFWTEMKGMVEYDRWESGMGEMLSATVEILRGRGDIVGRTFLIPRFSPICCRQFACKIIRDSSFWGWQSWKAMKTSWLHYLIKEPRTSAPPDLFWKEGLFKSPVVHCNPLGDNNRRPPQYERKRRR